jgi:hypothetical protein
LMMKFFSPLLVRATIYKSVLLVALLTLPYAWFRPCSHSGPLIRYDCNQEMEPSPTTLRSLLSIHHTLSLMMLRSLVSRGSVDCYTTTVLPPAPPPTHLL